MSTRATLKRGSLPRKKSHATHPKDQLLCELEMRHTISQTQIRQLEKEIRQLKETQAAESQNRESPGILEALREHFPIGYLTFDQSGRIRDANTEVARLVGLP